MPEAAVNEDGHHGATEDEVGRPPYWLQWSRRYTVAKAHGVKVPTKRHLWTGIS
jgi:hypothetical protein